MSIDSLNAKNFSYRNVSFISDFGYQDEYVSAVHGVIKSKCSGIEILDITHGIEPYDVNSCGLILARSAAYLPSGIVIASVDAPSARQHIAVMVGNGESILIGPDNGILAPTIGLVGGASIAVVLDKVDIWLAKHANFAARDVYAPAACELIKGSYLAEIGTEIDPIKLLPAVLPVSETDDNGIIQAQVLSKDHYGNIRLNVDPKVLDSVKATSESSKIFVNVKIANNKSEHSVQIVKSFAELRNLGKNQLALMEDSCGLLGLFENRNSAAQRLNLDANANLEIHLNPDIDLSSQNSSSVGVPVQFGNSEN